MDSSGTLPVVTTVCEVCRNPEISKIERAWIDKTMSIPDILKALSITKYKWYHHVKHHLKPEVAVALSANAEILAADTVDKVGEVVEQLDRLKSKLEKFDDAMQGAGIDHNDYKIWLSLETAIARNIETLAKIQGEYKDATIINANNVTVEYNQFNQMVMQEACPVCKKKFAEKMDNIIKVSN